MQITRAGEYGVLGLLHLAREGEGRMVMIDQISQREKMPKSFLAKIFQSLVRAGLVRSYRGAGGGFSLTRSPESITVLEVIEAIEGKIALQRCLQEVPDCEHMQGCALCGLFEQAQDQVREVFSKTTLAGLLAKEATLPPSTTRNTALVGTPVPPASPTVTETVPA
jgi:Rrf2 family transcriptional regulator, iron-sulfur cluster assembly transcription factor